uniref:ATP synthase F0 subunit 8 n=1 Tax=Majangella moultoni TaxID=3112547 RepID=UPI003002C002|nr:ATP synthase F0 subunit 8 [Majangella moultoni]
MPQMMPLNWLLLFLFFSILLIMFNIANYYMPVNKSTSLLPTKLSIKTLNWKW